MSAAEEPAEDKGKLGRPSSIEELYNARGADVDHLRPVCQGDVYEGLRMPGLDDDELVILMAHPCSMRKGASLRPRLQASPVRSYQKVPLEKWPSSHTRVLPLPECLDTHHHAAEITEIGSVRSADLRNATRVATLSREGILLLQQRIIYTLSGAVVGLDTLADYSAIALDELELLEDWNEALCGDELQPPELYNALDSTAVEFENFLKTGPREQLANPVTRSQARTIIAAEARRRREQSTNSEDTS